VDDLVLIIVECFYQACTIANWILNAKVLKDVGLARLGLVPQLLRTIALI